MLSVRRPRARRRERRRPLHWVGRARRRRQRNREKGRRRGARPLRPRGGRRRASAGGEGLPQGQRGAGMAARAGGAPVWGTQALPGRVDSGRGRGWAAAPSLLRPAPSRSSTLEPRPLHSPPPSSSSSDGLLFHLPAARAAGTSSARRRRRRKRWQQWLRHPIWRNRVGPRSSEIGGASQRAPWRPQRVARAAARKPSRSAARASPPGGPAALVLGPPALGPLPAPRRRGN